MGKRQRRPKSTKKRSKKSTKSKLFKILELLLRLVIYPIYVSYVLLKTVFIVKPKETIYSLKEKLSTGYSKSKKYYRKAKKFTVDDENLESSSDEDEDRGKKFGKKKKMKKKKMKFIKKLILKFIMLFKKLWSLVWKLLVKIKYLKKYLIMKIKWTIKKLYEMWLDTERIVYKIKGLPFAIIDKIKSFVKEAIEEPDQYDYEIVPKSQSNFPEPIQISDDGGSLDEIIITKTVTEWPDSKGHRPSTALSSRPISSNAIVSRGRPQSRQSKFSSRIEGTVPSRKFYAPPTNEELIDDYFNTFDAIQPHDDHRNSVRRRKRRVVTDEDVNTIEYVPERPVSRIVTSRDKNYDDDDYEETHQKSHTAYTKC